MKALLLNGERSEEESLQKFSKIIENQLHELDYDVNDVLLRDRNVAGCQGCFDCWKKTPGLCVIDDFGRELADLFINSHLVVLFTPVTFGGYSSELKKALDRLISLNSPFFKQIEGATHHQPRYEDYPSMLGIGIKEGGNKEKEKIFHSLVRRNAVNYYAGSYGSVVLPEDSALGEAKNQIGKNLAEVDKAHG